MGTTRNLPTSNLPSRAGAEFYSTTERFRALTSNVKFLDPDTERKLITTYQTTEDEGQKAKALEQLIVAFSPLVTNIAKTQMTHTYVDGMDLIQAGMIGLLRAIEKVSPDEGTGLASYAPSFIRSELLEQDFRTRPGSSPYPKSKDARKFFFNRSALRHQMNIPQSGPLTTGQVEATAAILEIDPSTVRDLDTHALSVRATSLSMPTSEDRDNDVTTLADMLPGNSPDPSDWLANKREAESTVKNYDAGMAKMNERERTIIQRRWLVDEAEIVSLTDLAHEFGVSPQRAKQIEESAFKKLRDAFGVTADVKAAGVKFSGPRRRSKINATPKPH